MDPFMVAFRIVHIGSAIVWAGGAALFFAQGCYRCHGGTGSPGDEPRSEHAWSWAACDAGSIAVR